MIKKAILLLVILYVISIFINFNGYKIVDEIEENAIITDYIVSLNQTNYYLVVTELFDHSKNCGDPKCRKVISDQIHNNIVSMKNTSYYEGIYFIRYNDGHLEKMFLDGTFKKVDNPNKKEVEVINFLVSNTSEKYLKGIRIDNIYTNMIYLQDFYSEAEIIVPIRTYDKQKYDEQKIVGAIVKGYGD